MVPKERMLPKGRDHAGRRVANDVMSTVNRNAVVRRTVWYGAA